MLHCLRVEGSLDSCSCHEPRPDSDQISVHPECSGIDCVLQGSRATVPICLLVDRVGSRVGYWRCYGGAAEDAAVGDEVDFAVAANTFGLIHMNCSSADERRVTHELTFVIHQSPEHGTLSLNEASFQAGNAAMHLPSCCGHGGDPDPLWEVQTRHIQGFSRPLVGCVRFVFQRFEAQQRIREDACVQA